MEYLAAQVGGVVVRVQQPLWLDGGALVLGRGGLVGEDGVRLVRAPRPPGAGDGQPMPGDVVVVAESPTLGRVVANLARLLFALRPKAPAAPPGRLLVANTRGEERCFAVLPGELLNGGTALRNRDGLLVPVAAPRRAPFVTPGERELDKRGWR